MDYEVGVFINVFLFVIENVWPLSYDFYPEL